MAGHSPQPTVPKTAREGRGVPTHHPCSLSVDGASECREMPKETSKTLPVPPGGPRVSRSVYCECPSIYEAFPRIRELPQRPYGRTMSLKRCHTKLLFFS